MDIKFRIRGEHGEAKEFCPGFIKYYFVFISVDNLVYNSVENFLYLCYSMIYTVDNFVDDFLKKRPDILFLGWCSVFWESCCCFRRLLGSNGYFSQGISGSAVEFSALPRLA